jgi:hypothetical protein
MIIYRLAQSNAWIYTVPKTTERDDPNDVARLSHECTCELQAWIMKMDPTREIVPEVETGEFYDYRNRQWSVRASYRSSTRLHPEEET